MSRFATGMGVYEIPGVYGASDTMPRKSNAMYNVVCYFDCLYEKGELETPPTQDEIERISIGWIDYLDESQLVNNMFADYVADKLEEIRGEA